MIGRSTVSVCAHGKADTRRISIASRDAFEHIDAHLLNFRNREVSIQLGPERLFIGLGDIVDQMR